MGTHLGGILEHLGTFTWKRVVRCRRNKASMVLDDCSCGVPTVFLSARSAFIDSIMESQ